MWLAVTLVPSLSSYLHVNQVAPWCFQASAVSSCGSAPLSPWWFSCCAFTTAWASLPGTPWMWSPLSRSLLSGGGQWCRWVFICLHHCLDLFVQVSMFGWTYIEKQKQNMLVCKHFVVSLSTEEQGLGSATLCVSWLQSWETWSLVLLLASPRPSPYWWPHLCSLVEAWLYCGCLTPNQMSSCNMSIGWDKTWIKTGRFPRGCPGIAG